MSVEFTVEQRMDALIAFWSHALARGLFAALTLWRLGDARVSRSSACSPAPLL